MEAVLGHVERVVELLAVSETHCVSEWDRQTVLSAVRWARYCERVHARLCSNPELRSALESRLRDTNRRLRDTFPSHSPVTVSDLAQCGHKLLVQLLRNPSAPGSVTRALTPDTPQQRSELDLTRLITCRSAFKLLCCSLDGTGAAEAEVRGKLLATRVSDVLTRSGNTGCAKALLDSVLLDSAGETGSLYDVIAAALLAETSDVTRDVILDWLKGHDGCLSKLCGSLSPGMCAVLSRGSVTFKRVYWDALKQWASCLEYDVMRSAWEPVCSVTSEEAVTFEVLVNRLSDLMNSGSPLKEETETELVALKLESGDFDVRGVSVWTDLIIQLKL